VTTDLPTDRTRADGPLPVLYRDERLVVIHNPSGLLVHRSAIDRHETRFAVQLLRDQLGQRVYPVHRLDKGTSGALAFALDPAAARVYSLAFGGAGVAKTYLALVRGWPAEQGRIERELAAVADDVLGSQSTVPRAARTTYQRLATYELPVCVDRFPTSRYALVQLQPLSGRRHQLRRHLAGASYPIIGDSTYGKGRHNRYFAERFHVQRLLLACTRLEFRTELNPTPLCVDAPLAPEFAALVDALGTGYTTTPALAS
jgi:tRNA pseudouridine65 synthase